MTRSTWILAILAAILSGCSFFEERVLRHDERILALQEQLAALPSDAAGRQELLAELEREKAAREGALEGAQQEAQNRQALLMALISLGAGGLKLAGGLAAKGAGA